MDIKTAKAERFQYFALVIALVIGFLSVAPYFGVHFEYIPGDLGDNRLSNYVLEHGYKWVTGRAPGSFFDAPFYYPARESIRYSDNLLGGLPFYIPWRLMGFDRETSFQIWIVLGYMLNYLAATWVLRKLRFHWFAVLAGAYVFTFSQAALTHSWHIQLLYRFAIPIAWYFLHRFFEEFQSKHLFAALIFIAWQFYCSLYLGYFLALFLAAYVGVKVCVNPIIRNYWRSITVRSATAQTVIIVGFLLLVGGLAKGYASSVADPQLMEARRPEVIRMLPRPISYLVGFTGSAETGWAYTNIDLPMKHEHVMFVGLIPWIALLVLLITTRKARRHSAVTPVLAAMFVIIGITLYVNGHSLYFMLMELPGVNGIRAVTRVILVLLLPFAIVTAQVLHLCVEKLRNITPILLAAFIAVVSTGLVLENRTAPYRYLKEDGQSRVRALTAQFPAPLPQNGILAYLYPFGGDWAPYEIDAMLAAQDRDISTMNGYSAAAPNGFRYLHSCTDIKLALDDIGAHSTSFPVEQPASRLVVVGAPRAACQPYLTREASIGTEPLPDDAFRARIEVITSPTLIAGAEFLSQVRITNDSNVRWRAKGLQSGKYALRVSCQWLQASSQVALMDYPNRFDLPYDLVPNETASIDVPLTAPEIVGDYTIECDAVQELVHWFHLMGSSSGKTAVLVQRDPATPAIQAFLDVVDANEIGGWVWDRDHQDVALQVEIRDGDQTLTTLLANRFRPDLLKAGFGTGKYSFSIPNPLQRASDGKSHTVRAFVSGTNIELTGSPKTFTGSR